jgi:hypothetical protein
MLSHRIRCEPNWMDIDGYAQPSRCASIRGSRREIAATVPFTAGTAMRPHPPDSRADVRLNIGVRFAGPEGGRAAQV